MEINAETLEALRGSLNTSFRDAFDGIESTYLEFATVVPSTSGGNHYDWLSDIPEIREWLDERQYNTLEENGYYIPNKDFEATIRVNRSKIMDGQLGGYTVIASGLGEKAAQFPDKLSYETLELGWTKLCLTGQNFFDDEHALMVNGKETTYSNIQAGTGISWYLLATGGVVKPILFQDRMKTKFESKGEGSDTAFDRNEYAFGPWIRAGAGYSFPQLACASRATLNAANLKALRVRMKAFVDTNGNKRGIKPTLLIVPSELEDAARELMEAKEIGGVHNTLKGAFTLLVGDRLDGEDHA
ncbi:MAG: Mu-like prophage major head subunit gpT family protein [Robiginitomaculum sp.]|nr:Mu-like prophage major head subunit gpT family protein [Robiginitomaculum sp.]